MRFPKNGTDYLTPLSLSNSGATRSSHENKVKEKKKTAVHLKFEKDCRMENVRAYMAVRSYMAGRSWMMA